MTSSTGNASSSATIRCHADLAEAGRYYDEQRVIVLRRGMFLVEQRAVLWHELCTPDGGTDGA